MSQLCDHLCFLFKPFERTLLPHLVHEHRFERDNASQVQLSSPVDNSHPSLTKHAQNFVSRHNLSRSQERFDNVNLYRVEQPLLQSELGRRRLLLCRFDQQLLQHWRRTAASTRWRLQRSCGSGGKGRSRA